MVPSTIGRRPLVQHVCRDSKGYSHFRRGGNFWEQVGSGRGRRIALVIAAGGSLVYVTHLETVPYTGRTHFVFPSVRTEVMLGRATFEQACNPPPCRRVQSAESDLIGHGVMCPLQVKRAAHLQNALLPADHPAARMVTKLGR